MRLHVDVGSRFPALISATGRCVAAFSEHPWSEVERRFRSLRWQNAPNYETWRKEIDGVRRHGFSIDRGNYIAGVAIAAVGLVSQLDRATSVRLAHDMRVAAETVTSQLVSQA